VQRELLQICLHEGAPLLLAELVAERLASIPNLDEVARRIWIAAAFILDLPVYRTQVAARVKADKSLLWSIKDLIRFDSHERRRLQLTIAQLELLIQEFSPLWPVVEHPSSGWSGDENPWDATDDPAHLRRRTLDLRP
jgi:hypothetical protein